MYCPRCGQQQISHEMRFCSRCGLAMSGLAEWVAGGGVAAGGGADVHMSAPSPRRKGIRRGAKLLFLSAVLFPIFFVISLIFNEGATMVVPFIILFASLVIMLYSRLFADDSAPATRQHALVPGLDAMSQRSALPPPSNIPIQDPANFARQQSRPNELAHPPSVTEHTTKLLDNE